MKIKPSIPPSPTAYTKSLNDKKNETFNGISTPSFVPSRKLIENKKLLNNENNENNVEMKMK